MKTLANNTNETMNRVNDPAAVLSAVAAAGETVTAYQVEEIKAL